MTGLLLVGPPPGPAPAAPRAAQSLRTDGPGFADALRGVSTTPDTKLREPEAEPPSSDTDTTPEPADTAEPTAGETPDAADRDEGETSGDPDERPAPDAEQRKDDEAEAESDETPAAAPAATNAQRSQTTVSDGARAQEEPARAGRRETVTQGRTQTGSPAIAADDEGQTKADGKAPAVEVAGASAKRAASADAKTSETTNTQQAQQGVAAGAGDAGAATAGDADGDETGARSGDRNAAERVVQKSDPAGAFELSRADAKPSGEAPVREAPTQPATEAARPSSLRIETAGASLKGAEQAGRSAEPAEDSAAMTAVKRGLGAAVRQRGGSVTIKLSPESLGQVRIEMQIRQGAVELRFDAGTEQARELLTRHADMLRTTLQQKGFGVDRIEVHTQPSQAPGSRAGADASGDDASQRRNQEHDAGGRESRGSFGQQGDGRREGAWRDDDDAPATFEQWRVRVNATA